MTRVQWMWLWIWLLIFLIIFCVLTHLNSFIENSSTQNLQTKQNPSLKILKNEKVVTISGNVSSKDEAISIQKQYELFFDNVKNELKISPNVKKLKCFGIVQNLAYHFLTNFENGSLECKDQKFFVKGSVVSPQIESKTKQIIQNYNVNELQITNDIDVIEPITKKQKVNKELYELLNSKVIEFVKSKDEITPKSQAVLDEVFDILNKHKGLKIQIEGHTDSDGDEKINQFLSEVRAVAVKKYLVKKGIDPKSLTTVGFGESKPIVDNNSTINKQKNRRVEFKVLGE